ncbi:hypothetical protein ABZ599_39065 [Streptomyces misionensis]|uniref:hypothetical protein n=1 Tax=Streptomyces misionensis TaxID=67331 RepID=UPI0033D92A7F
MLELIRRANESGELWDYIVLQDIVLTLQAGNGIRGRFASRSRRTGWPLWSSSPSAPTRTRYRSRPPSGCRGASEARHPADHMPVAATVASTSAACWKARQIKLLAGASRTWISALDEKREG